MKRSIAEINAMSAEDFTAVFGDVAEHSPWVSRQAASTRPFATREAMIQAFTAAVQEAAHELQLALLRAHPDLAARARLSADSSREQAGAGLGELTAAELSRFDHLNNHYRSKFGFPFILVVRGATKQQILSGFSERVNNSAASEFAIALVEVARIFRFRIEDRVEP